MSQKVKYRAKLTRELTEVPQHVWVADKLEVMVYRLGEEIKIFSSICPHMGAQLVVFNGGREVFCPWHGLKYEARTEKSDHHKYKRICSHTGAVENGELLIFE